MQTVTEGVRKEDGVVLLRVAAKSIPSRVAGAIVKYMEEGNRVALVAMGAGAINQAVKAIASARGMAAPAGHDLYCVPAFSDETIDGQVKTAMKFFIERQ